MEQTELERWWSRGVPPDMFKHPDFINLDVQTLIGAILDHLRVRNG